LAGARNNTSTSTVQASDVPVPGSTERTASPHFEKALNSAIDHQAGALPHCHTSIFWTEIGVNDTSTFPEPSTAQLTNVTFADLSVTQIPQVVG
jgi:hypothetical protein